MSTRKTILNALAKHGQCTYDDLERLTGIARDKAQIAINDAKKAGHVSLQKDDVTGQPAYKITPAGKGWVQKNPVGEEDKAANQPPAKTVEIKVSVSADKAVAELKEAASEIEIIGLKARLAELESILSEWQRVASSASCTSPSDLNTFLAFQDSELVDAKAKANEAQERLAELELECADKISTAQLGTVDPVGYVVASPNKPLRRFKKNATAQASAIVSARANGLAEVFALYPHAKAIRGVEWKPLSSTTRSSS